MWFHDEETIRKQRWLLEMRTQVEEFDGQWGESMEEFAARLQRQGGVEAGV